MERLNNKKLLNHSTEVLTKKVSFEWKGLKVESLSTSREIAAHGIEMHHCIQSYTDRVKAGEYNVLVIRGSEGEVCTLGVYIDKSRSDTVYNLPVIYSNVDNWNVDNWYVDQCKGKCNATPFINNTTQKTIAIVFNKIRRL